MSFCKSSALPLVIAATILSGCSSLKNKTAEAPEKSIAAASAAETAPAASDSAQTGSAADSSGLQANGMNTDQGQDAANGKNSNGKNPKGKKTSGGTAQAADGQSSGKGRSQTSGNGGKLTGQLNSLSDTLFFAYDDFTLSDDDKQTLDDLAARMNTEPALKVELLGYADERGTINYNLALGERRGNTAEAYLRNLGISADRLEVISYGETKPVAEGHDEEAWARNRRVEIVLR